MTELNDDAKSAIRDYLAQRLDATEEKQHRRIVRNTAIAGVVVGGFFALSAGVVGALFSNIQKSAITQARNTAIEVVNDEASSKAMSTQRTQAFDAIAAARIATGTAVSEAQQLQKQTAALKQQSTELNRATGEAISQAEKLKSRAEILLGELERQSNNLRQRQRDLDETEGVLLAAKSLAGSQQQIVEAALDSPSFRQRVAEQVSPVPPGAVIAFDEDCSKIIGWEPYRQGRGKFILGYNGSAVVGEQIGDTAGSNTVVLLKENIPSHTHTLPSNLLTADTIGTNLATGGGVKVLGGIKRSTIDDGPVPQKVKITPVHVILSYCRKN